MSIDDIRGLTVYRPWSEYIADGLKPLENRDWTPWKTMLGKYLAIHASVRWDQQAADFIDRARGRLQLGNRPVKRLEECRTGIIAVTQLVGWVEIGPHGPGQAKVVAMLPGHSYEYERDGRWFFGRYGWLLRGAVRFEPVECKGKQGFWKLEPDLYERVRRRYDLAREKQRGPDNVDRMLAQITHEQTGVQPEGAPLSDAQLDAGQWKSPRTSKPK